MLFRSLAKVRKRREQRRRRWQTVGAALVAACLAALAVFGVRAVGIGGGPQLTAMQELVANSPVEAQLAVESVADGSEVHMHCTYKERDASGPAEGHWTFRLVAVPKSGEPLELNEWTATYGDEYTLTGHTKLARRDLARLEIRRADGTPVLVYNINT